MVDARAGVDSRPPERLGTLRAQAVPDPSSVAPRWQATQAQSFPFCLREETNSVLKERLAVFENRLVEDVSKIGVRELALLVDIDHMDEVLDRARE